MSLRLLPAIAMDNDDDDDGNFTKWMSSYWGHGAESGHSRERKNSFRRLTKAPSDRRASLPCVSQLDAMKLNRLASAPIHTKTREDKGEVRPHSRARRSSSDDNSRSKTAIPENRITTIPELAESFEKRLFLQDKKAVPPNEADNLCLICHEEMRNSRGGIQEMQCTHRFHKEAARRLGQGRPRSGSLAAEPEVRCLDERRKSADEQSIKEQVYHAPLRQLSLRRHR